MTEPDRPSRGLRAALRRSLFPLGLARARLARRQVTVVLVAVGIAAGAGVLAAVLGGSLVAQDRRVTRAAEEITPPARAVRAVWYGVPGQSSESYTGLDRTAKRALAGVVGTSPTPLVLFRSGTIGGSLISLGAVDGLSRWVHLRSGRLPKRCVPSHCEVLRIDGRGRVPSLPGLRLVQVGEATLDSAVLFGDFIAPAKNARGEATLSPLVQQALAYHRPQSPLLLLANGVAGLTRSPVLSSVYRSYAWVVPIGPGTVRLWRIPQFGGAVERASSELQAASPEFALTAPVQELEAARSASVVAGRRLLLIGGEAAALLFAFAMLAAASMRRDVELAHRRLTWFGARRSQLVALTLAESATIAVVGVVAGWASGVGVAALVAGRAGAPTGSVLAHSVLSTGGIALAVGAAAVATAILFLALRAKPVRVRGFSISLVDAAAIGAAAVVAVAVARGDVSAQSLASEPGLSAFLVLLPGLVTFAAAVAFARLLAPCLRLGARLARRRSVAARLAALSLARRPGPAAVAVAFFVVSLGLALFAESYRSSLEQGQEDQAAFAVPLDFTVKEDLSHLIPVLHAAPLDRFRTLGPGVEVEPVARLTGSVTRLGVSGFDVLGLDPGTLPRLHGWRASFSTQSLPALERTIEPEGPTGLRGIAIPDGARALVLPARGASVPVAASVETRGGDFVSLDLGTVGPDGTPLEARLPPEAAGGKLVALVFSPPPRIEENGAVTGTAFDGTLEVGRPSVRVGGTSRPIGSLATWIGVDGIEPAAEGGNVRVRYSLSGVVESQLRPRQPTDGHPVPVIASPRLAAAASGGVLPVAIGGAHVLVRVAAVASRFPGAGSDFLVGDRALLQTAVDTDRPGAAPTNEVWLASGSTAGTARVAAQLERPPFDVLSVTSRAQVRSDLKDDPLAEGALWTLLGAALIALCLALVGLLVGLAGDLRDERRELDDLEAQGARPSTLRRIVRLRSGLVAGFGLAGGLAVGALLTLLVVDLITVTADAGLPEPPLRLAIDWRVVLLAIAVYVAVSAAVVASVTRGAFRSRGAPARYGGAG